MQLVMRYFAAAGSIPAPGDDHDGVGEDSEYGDQLGTGPGRTPRDHQQAGRPQHATNDVTNDQDRYEPRRGFGQHDLMPERRRKAATEPVRATD